MSLHDQGAEDTKASVLGVLSFSFWDYLLSGNPAKVSQTDACGKELRLPAKGHGHELRGGTSSPIQASDVCCPQ